jgi:hypothetical protein
MGVAQVVKPLPRKCEALSSNSSTTKKKEKKTHKDSTLLLGKREK